VFNLVFKRILDAHTHTDNSPDGHHSTMYLCERAEIAGMRGITFTDHVEIDYYLRDHYDRVAVQSYFEIAKARSAFTGKLLVCAGIELGQPMYDVETADKVVKSLRYDQVIGAVHNLRGMPDFSYLDYSEHDLDILLRDYFHELDLMVRWGNFDTLAHLTYPLRYITGEHKIDVSLTKYAGLIDEILSGLAEKGKALEINTSGLRQKLGKTMPGADIIRRFRQLGGEYVTIGSDAHWAEHIGAGISEGMKLAKHCGFSSVTLYQKREPILIPIE